MTVLVTGGAGYVGSVTTRLLVQSGVEVVVIDSLERGDKTRIPNVHLETGDICDFPILKKILKNHDVKSVMHFAGYKSVQESLHKPNLYIENNVKKSIQLFDFLFEHNVKNVIFSSSCSVYGEHGVKLLNEKDACVPLSPYAESKLQVEEYLASARGVRASSLRYFNAAGADLVLNIGENPISAMNLIPFLIRSIFRNDNVQIHGGDFDTRDKTGVRDYVHVSDIARAHVAALRFLEIGEDGADIRTVNLGAGVGRSVLDVIELIERTTRLKLRYSLVGARKGDPSYAVADTEKARNHLGWFPEHDIVSIITSAVDWFRISNQR